MKTQKIIKTCLLACYFIMAANAAIAGPYTEAGVNGYIDSDFRHANPLTDPNVVLNPIFRGWATGYRDYLPSDTIIHSYLPIPGYICIDPEGHEFYLPQKALGPATGDVMDIVSLGDLSSTEIANGENPGEITLIFGNPDNVNDPNHIKNQAGYDFVVFENGFVSGYTTDAGTVAGQMFAELACVEVSSDGEHFVRFPTVSLTPQPTGATSYLTLDITGIYNFAGKHPMLMAYVPVLRLIWPNLRTIRMYSPGLWISIIFPMSKSSMFPAAEIFMIPQWMQSIRIHGRTGTFTTVIIRFMMHGSHGGRADWTWRR